MSSLPASSFADRSISGFRGEYLTFFWKGRVAFHAILKAIELRPNLEVLLPGFTCVVMANVIKYAKAVPVYLDIDPATYVVNVDKLADAAKRSHQRGKIGCIVAQNTFGLSADLDPIMEIADRYGVLVIEDCAHGLGGRYKGRRNGTVADAAFFSTQWSKPFSTGIGGIAYSRRPDISAKLRGICSSFAVPGPYDRAMLRVLTTAQKALVNPRSYWSFLKAYRLLSAGNLVIGSSSSEELEDTLQPEGFEKQMAPASKLMALNEMERLPLNVAHRKEVAAKYNAIFNRLGLDVPFVPSYADHLFLRYPLRVKDKSRFLAEAERARLEAGDWFVSPLHPVIGDLGKYGYERGQCPEAELACQTLVNLPTHHQVDEIYLADVEQFLKRMLDKGVVR